MGVEEALPVKRAFARPLYARENDRLHRHAAGSRTTSRAFLSSRNPANRECRRWLAEVHSVYSICATSSGFSQWHFFITSAVSASPRRAFFGSGRLAKGHTGVSRGRIRSNRSLRVRGTKPFLTVPMKISLPPS